FKIGKKRFTLNMKVFKRSSKYVLNQEFDALSSDEETVSFIKEFGHKGDIKSVSDADVDHMHQPWRTFASIINKYLFVYGALRPEAMTNQKMQNSHAYKTYLEYTKVATPKKARKFKKHASLSKKRTLVIVEEEEPPLLRKLAKCKSIDTSKGTGLKLEVSDVSKADSSESEYESWGDSGDEANVKETNDDEKETDDEFVHTPPNYVPTDDETNDESNDVDEKSMIGLIKNSEATTSTIDVPDSETLTALHQSIADLEKDVKELKDVDNSTKVISTIKYEVLNVVKEYLGSSLDDALHKMVQVRKRQVPKETITSFDTTALEEFDQKTTLFETMTKSKSLNKSPKHKALYHALTESILKDEEAMDECVAEKLKKRKPDDADKDEGPSARSD
nr:hypothetical protein [Tanacetum cinerariifolium]